MGSGVRGTGQLKGTGFLKGPAGPVKNGSGGPGKKGSGGPGKKGSGGPGKKGSGGPGKKGSGGPGKAFDAKAVLKAQGLVFKAAGSGGPKGSGGNRRSGGAGAAQVIHLGDTTTITDNFGAHLSSLVELSPTQGPGETQPAGNVTAGLLANAGPQDVQALKEDIARALGRSTKSLDELFKESGGAKWSVADLLAVRDIIEKIPPNDRLELANTTFERTATLPSEDGRPNYGHIEFSRSDFRDHAVIKIGDVATGKDAQGNTVGPNVVGQVVAHEIGHIVQGDGRWNSNEVREFAKLSHWVRQGPPETLVNGYDDYFRTSNFETRDYAKNSTNFVSDYAKESAVEDYAESYRVYISNPGELMAKAPDKFLYINAQSKKYSAEQVQGFANVVGANLPFVMASLARSNLRPKTLDAISRQNGLAVPEAGSAAGDAIAAIQQRSLDPAFGLKLRQDPRAALGDATWNKLSASEQALLQDDAYVNKLLAVTAANKTSPSDTVTDGDVAGWKGFLKDLLLEPPTDPRVLAAFTGGNAMVGGVLDRTANPDGPGAFNRPPEGILAGQGQDAKLRYDYLWDKLHEPEHWNQLSPQMQALFNSEQGKQFIAQMASDKNNLDMTKLAWSHEQAGALGRVPVPDIRRFDNVKNYIDKIGPADIEALGGLIRRGITAEEAEHVGRANQALAQGGVMPMNGHIPAM